MKELSIEEKAKAYDKALEVLHKYDGAHIMFTQDLKEEMFPELAESEDERIRKELLDYFKNKFKKYPSDPKFSVWIAWLEKQGEQKDILEDATLDNNEDGLIADTIKAKGEQKPNPCENCSIATNNCQNFPCTIRNGEHKPADKVEPKFRIEAEKWYICISQYCNCIKGRCYQALSYGRIIDDFGTEYDMHSDADKYFRLWTIQDAKDGDVLSFNDGHGNDCIELIKSITDKKIEFWFCLTNGNRYEVFDGIIPYTNLISKEDATPATKVQRDLLFQKMQEAGYEWDAEKKELRKIAQNPVIEIKTTEESLGVDSDTYNKIVDECVYGEQKPWSEEDEVGLGDAMWAIKQAMTIAKDENDMGNLWYAERWLKSIKDRVQPRLQQEWSDEDEDMRYKATVVFNRLCAKGKEYVWSVETLKKIFYWLESLRPQNTWKPSEEMLEALYRVIPKKVFKTSKEEILLDELYQGLKYSRVLNNK